MFEYNKVIIKHSLKLQNKNKTGTDEESTIVNAFKVFDAENKGSIHREA